MQHEQIRQGMQFTKEQIDFFVLALYDLDRFRTQLDEEKLPQQNHYSANKDACRDDEQLLLFGIDWLQRLFFQK